MEVNRKHIAFRIISTLIVVTLLFPTIIKLVHTLEEHHEHTFCEKRDSANLHECEIDCPIFKYNLQQYYIKSSNYNVDFCFSDNFEIPSLGYHFFNNYRVLSFSLRGPPALV
ncbi:hypothetical protein GCM10011368_12790 [Hyunsoonleella pacifica]|nr:hypothetical protein GCM10011368_12790 [Hyunsoonleella pacifica]